MNVNTAPGQQFVVETTGCTLVGARANTLRCESVAVGRSARTREEVLEDMLDRVDRLEEEREATPVADAGDGERNAWSDYEFRLR